MARHGTLGPSGALDRDVAADRPGCIPRFCGVSRRPPPTAAPFSAPCSLRCVSESSLQSSTLVLSRPQYVKATALSQSLPTAGQLEKYTLVSETEEGPNENYLKALFREFAPVEAATEPVASRVTAGAGVARDVDTAKTGLPDPLKDASTGKATGHPRRCRPRRLG